MATAATDKRRVILDGAVRVFARMAFASGELPEKP